MAAGARDEAVLHRHQVTGHQREQVTRLGVRIGPGDAMPTVPGIFGSAGIAVRQHDRNAGSVGGDRGGKPRHYVRAIGEIRDPTETLRLALREEAAV